MFDTALKKKRIVGLLLLIVLLSLFLWFNRIPKLDVVEADLVGATAPAVKCFQGFCVDNAPNSTLFSRWWDFSLSYLKLVALGMVFAFLIAGLTEVFLFPSAKHGSWSHRGLKGSFRGLLVGSAMNLCSACIVPISNAFRRRGAGIETTLAITQGSSTLNLPALLMVALVFTPMLAGTRVGVSLVGALLLGPLVARLVGQRKQPLLESLPVAGPLDPGPTSWGEVLTVGFRDWLKASLGYLLRLGPIMVLAGFASGLAIQWLSPSTVSTYLGDNALGVAIAATVGLLINVPLLFEIPLVAALLLVGMGTAPAATLLFAAAAGGPITFWGLARVMPKKAVVTFAAATWGLGLIAGLSILAIGPLVGGNGPNLRASVAISPAEGATSESLAETGSELSGMLPHDGLTIINIEPAVGTTLGGTMVIITGTGLLEVTKVTIGGVETDIAESLGLTALAIMTPAHEPGEVDVEVSGPDGDTSTMAGGFSYQKAFFSDVGKQAGVDFTHYRDFWDIIPLGAGVIIFDYNNDGNQDIYVSSTQDVANLAAETDGHNALYRNNGDGTFTDIAEQAGVSDLSGKGNGGCAADYENDGDQDLFVANWGSSKLFNNGGDGTFTDVTADAGLGDPDATYRSMGCAWGDYDRDGFLDLIVVRHIDESNPDAFNKRIFFFDVRLLALYHNNGDGTFSDMTHLLGATQRPTHEKGNYGNVWGAGFQPSWVDFDNDGDPDLYVVNDFGEDIQPNVLWRNDGLGPDGAWRFVDISAQSGADAAMFGMGLAVADYNTDGYLDVFITNMGDNVLLTSNRDGLTFSNTAAEAGVDVGLFRQRQRVSWGTVFFDYDNDGYEDLYIASGFLDTDSHTNRMDQPNLLFHNNNGDGTFADVSSISGADDWEIGRGVAYADFNGDGCLDLYLVNLGRSANVGQRAKLFQNSCEWMNAWLIIKTVGTVSNRDGIGARVKVVAGGRTQIREVAAGGSNKSQNMLPVHFGLGNADRVDTVEILWPSGTVQTLTNVAANQRLTITEHP